MKRKAISKEIDELAFSMGNGHLGDSATVSHYRRLLTNLIARAQRQAHDAGYKDGYAAAKDAAIGSLQRAIEDL